jgi:hypothetical protein
MWLALSSPRLPLRLRNIVPQTAVDFGLIAALGGVVFELAYEVAIKAQGYGLFGGAIDVWLLGVGPKTCGRFKSVT